MKKILSVAIVVALFGVIFFTGALADEKTSEKIPAVPFKYALGLKKFQAMCSSCHGDWGRGTKQGPPLMHGFYKPSHHGDRSFYNAALNGVRAHHWNFGDMPPVPGATVQDLDAIVPFVRWLQKENGLY